MLQSMVETHRIRGSSILRTGSRLARRTPQPCPGGQRVGRDDEVLAVHHAAPHALTEPRESTHTSMRIGMARRLCVAFHRCENLCRSERRRK
jgi:hypothetical protein